MKFRLGKFLENISLANTHFLRTMSSMTFTIEFRNKMREKITIILLYFLKEAISFFIIIFL